MTYRVFAFAEIKEPLHHPRRRPRHRPPPTSRESSQISMYILCCSNRICGCPSGRSCSVYTLSGLCFDGMLINFHSSKFQALNMSFFRKGHADFSVNSGMTCARICREYREAWIFSKSNDLI